MAPIAGVIFLIMGLTFYGFMLVQIQGRDSSKGVRASLLGLPDLILSSCFIGLAGFVAVMVLVKGKPPTPRTFSAEEILNGATVFAMPLALIFVSLRFRGIPLREFFGFTALRPVKAVMIASVALIAVLPPVLLSAYLVSTMIKERATEQEAVTVFREAAKTAQQEVPKAVDNAPPSEEAKALAEKKKQTWIQLLLIAISACIIAPLSEELLFRGYIYPSLKRYIGATGGALLAAALFSACHFNLASLLPLFILALALTVMYERTSSLLVPMYMHGIFNFFQLVQLWQTSANPT